MNKARAEAKRHIYRCLSSIVTSDLDAGGDYIWDLVEGNDGRYDGKKLPEPEVVGLINEIAAELLRRGTVKPSSPPMKGISKHDAVRIKRANRVLAQDPKQMSRRQRLAQLEDAIRGIQSTDALGTEELQQRLWNEYNALKADP